MGGLIFFTSYDVIYIRQSRRDPLAFRAYLRRTKMESIYERQVVDKAI
jgi:hypothetical protein